MSKLNLLLGVAFLAGCSGGSVMRAGGPPEMYVHYQQVGEIHHAVVMGDIGATRAPARALARSQNHYGEPAQNAWDLLMAEARVILAQNELLDLSRSVARMGMACGRCHLAMDEGPDINPGPAPPPSRQPGEHMARHQWAVDRLWEGLVAPSERGWAVGASALGDEALDLGPPGNRPEEADRLAARVHELGAMARRTEAWEDRARIYGQLLQTCALCHEYLGLRMR